MTMSKLILTAVTFAAVLTHATFGCCWHHDHHAEFLSPESTLASICQTHDHSSQGEPSDGHEGSPRIV